MWLKMVMLYQDCTLGVVPCTLCMSPRGAPKWGCKPILGRKTESVCDGGERELEITLLTPKSNLRAFTY